MRNKLAEKIVDLKKNRDAIILAHNYQRAEVQDVADFVGDSLGLSRQAAGTSAEVILFCGVHFMAETAAILCPQKMVLMPDRHAGCPMAAMVTARELLEKKKKYPGARVVCYVNSSAAVKAESDICCTSSNAQRVVSSIPEDEEVLFIPDKSLGAYVASQLKREIILWEGYCPTHHRILASDILRLKAQHPGARVIVHPECTPDVIALADHVASTTGIARYASEVNGEAVIVGTENGILHRLHEENPRKTFLPATPLAECPNMKLNTLEKVLWALEDMEFHVTVPKDTAERALRAIRRMFELS